jgi:diguanylate cyclase (GGDEF)-like protein/PAS domain S-box-containing protein
LRRNGVALRLVACYLAVAAATFVIEVFEKWEPQGNMLWLANGLLLAYLLLAPRWRWPAYLSVGFLALSFRLLFLPGRWREFLLFNLLDILEVAIAALLLHRQSKLLPRFTERAYLVRFVALAGLLAPALAAGIYAFASHAIKISPHPHPFLNWMASDSLGIVIGTPAFVAVLQTRFRKRVNWRKNWFYPALLVVISLASFVQNSVPLLYLVYPLLVLVVVRLGLGFASIFMLQVAIVAGWFTIRGSGPFWAAGTINPILPSLLLQVFAASAMATIYCVSVVLESLKSTERRLRETVALHNLVTENSRDIILLAGFDGIPRYISPAVATVTGWDPEETMQRGFAEVAHPDDLPRIEAMIRKVIEQEETGRIEYRVRKRSGGFVWVEGNIRAVHNPQTGAPVGILQVVRDISERKSTEKKLQAAYQAVEALALRDPLTGLANRRRFDQYLALEWRRGLREKMPLSLLMIDVDLFKSYNDQYGHLRGDICLKQIAEAAMDVVLRTGDLVTRFGGEEFAVILPNTANDGAMQIAAQICQALNSRKLAHSGNPVGIVTVSIGCATIVPCLGGHPVSLIQLADEALYKAKHGGRNRVCNGGAQCAESGVGGALLEAINK